jgi:hypothetical protein
MSIGKQTTSSVIVGLPSESGSTADSRTSSFTAEQQTGYLSVYVFIGEGRKIVPECSVGAGATVIALTLAFVLVILVVTSDVTISVAA